MKENVEHFGKAFFYAEDYLYSYDLLTKIVATIKNIKIPVS